MERDEEHDRGGVVLRTAGPGDALAVAEVHVRSWQAAYRGLIPDEYLDGLRPEDRAARYTFGEPDPARPTTVIALDDATVVGFATIGPARDEDRAGGGELYALYVDPPSWSAGVGRVLMAEARRRLSEWGHAEATLWVLLGNARAERFYRTDGWRPDGAVRVNDVWGATVDELRYRSRLG